MDSLREINLRHLFLLSDEVGIMQHALRDVPDRRHGYSADDVGRALVVLSRLYEMTRREDLLRLITACLAFLRHAQTETGHFHNYMSYDRRFLDDRGSEDTLGRVVWGLGYVIRFPPTEGMAALAHHMVQESEELLANLASPRSQAYAICGLSAILEKNGRTGRHMNLVWHLSSKLMEAYRKNRREGWDWFEDVLAYGNAKMPEALLLAYGTTGERELMDVGLSTLDFLISVMWNGDYFDLVGNKGWFPRNGCRAVFGQQPIDAGYLVEVCTRAYEVTGNEKYLVFARAAYGWFFGRNRLGVPLYDPETGAVSDGLEADGVNPNKGAESLICFLLGVLALRRVSSTIAGQEMEYWYASEGAE